MTDEFILYNVRLVDPETDFDGQGGLYVKNGIIEDIGTHIDSDYLLSVNAIDCNGLAVIPALIDMNVGVGEPAGIHKENFETIGQAALSGGVGTILMQPTTSPALDNTATVDHIIRKAEQNCPINVLLSACITQDYTNKMTEIGLLSETGIKVFSNGDVNLSDALAMRRAMTYAAKFNAIIMNHVEEPSLSTGIANEGLLSSLYGLAGIPDIAEVIALERDLRLAELTGCTYMAAQLSSAQSILALQPYKNKHNIYAGVSAAHLLMNENDIIPYKTFAKLKPPLRREEDRVALVNAVCDGVIDVIVSAHRPLDVEEKNLPFGEAAFGSVGIETLLPTVLNLWHTGKCTLTQALKPVTCNPAKILKLPQGRLQKNCPADFVLIDLYKSWKLDRDDLKSRSHNSAFDGHLFEGKVIKTYIGGKEYIC